LNHLYIDFETRAIVDLKKTGAWKYSLDENTIPLCLGYAINDSPIKILNRVEILEAPPKEILDILSYENMFTVAHNAGFEYAIWNNILHKRFNWPYLPINKLICTAAIARYNGLPGALEKTSLALFEDAEKDMVGHRLMLQLARLKMPSHVDPNFWENNPDKFKRLYEYCKTDVELERKIHRTLGNLTKPERKLWLLDQKINLHGVALDLPRIKKSITISKVFDKRILKDFNQLTGLKSPRQVAELMKYLNKNGEDIENLQKKTIETYKPKTEKGKEAIKYRTYLSRSSVAKLSSMLNLEVNGIVRNNFIYHGATTGRWTSVGVQLQNIPRGELSADNVFDDLDYLNKEDFLHFYPDTNQAISAMLRGMVIPRPGKVFISGDFSAVEARGNFWLSGEIKGIKAYEAGKDLYKEMASDLYRKAVDKITKDNRFYGKQLILGAGYGLGHKKFKMMCEQYGQIITLEFAKGAITKYREKYSKVVRNWYAQENAAVMAMQFPGRTIACRMVKWKFDTTKKVLKCLLPSGRVLKYWTPKLEVVMTPWKQKKAQLSYMGINPKTKQWVKERTYGGKIVENIVQGICRDLLVFSLHQLDKAGFDIVMHAHDEVVVESEFNKVEEFKRLMNTTPDWAKGFPLNSDTWVGNRYKKD